MADYNPTGKPRLSRNRDTVDTVIKPGTPYYVGDPYTEQSSGGSIIATDTRYFAEKALKDGIAGSALKFNNDLADITSGLFDLLIKKHTDYGPKNISQSPGGPLNGLRVRMWDKIARINNLIDSGATPENESLIDSYRDLANYSIIAIMVLEGKWPTE